MAADRACAYALVFPLPTLILSICAFLSNATQNPPLDANGVANRVNFLSNFNSQAHDNFLTQA